MLVVKGARFAEGGNLAVERVVFIGSSIVFPDMMLRVMELEFEGIGVQRLDSLDLEGRCEAEVIPRLVIVDERFADVIEHRLDQIRRRYAGAKVVLAYRDAEVARRVLARQQGDGLLFASLHMPISCWMSMLCIFLSGDVVIPGELIVQRTGAASPPGPAPAEAPPALQELLTEREREVIERVARGDRNKTIAGEIGVSEHTVKLHIHHIITKIGVQNRTAAANWYLAQCRTDETPPPST